MEPWHFCSGLEPMTFLFLIETTGIYFQGSRFFIRLKLLLAAQAGKNEASIFVLSRKSSVNELFDQIHCCVTCLLLLLHQLDLLLEDIVLGDLCGVLLFLKESSLLLCFDLLLCSPSFTLLLQQAG